MGEKPFFSSEVGKENISSELEESIFLGKVSADEGEEKESYRKNTSLSWMVQQEVVYKEN